MVEVVILACGGLLTLAAFAFEALAFVSVACWQPTDASAADRARAAKRAFDPFTRRMEVFSSLRRQRCSWNQFFGGLRERRITHLIAECGFRIADCGSRHPSIRIPKSEIR